jgi:hypothetical protein
LINANLSARPVGRALALSTAIVLLTGCASGGGQEEAVEADPSLAGGITVQVDNRINPPLQLTIFLRNSTIGQRTLGSVSPNRTRSFNVDLEIFGSDEFNMVAQRPNGTEIISTPFRISPGVTVNWRLPANGITVGH